MKQYIDTAQDISGNALPQATCKVLNYPSGTNASIFSDNGLTPIGTSIVSADVTGQFSFFVADGDYTLQLFNNGTLYKTQTPVSIFDGAAQVTFADTGAANAYAIANSALEKALRAGLRASFQAVNANTGASTLAYNTLAAKPIVFPGGGALTGGVILANGIYMVEYDGASWQLRDAINAGLNYARTPQEITAGVTPTNFTFPPGDVRRYGADPTGVADSTTAFNNALASNGTVYAIQGTYLLSATLNLISGQVFYGDGAKTVLQFSNNTTSNILGTGIIGTTVRDLKITVTGNGNQSYIGAVQFTAACTNCTAKNLDISGNSGCGVFLNDAISCRVQDCYFHNFNTVNGNGDVGDIYLGIQTGTGCRYCTITGNQCFGGAWHGIMMLTAVAAPGTTHNEFNVVANNRVGQHMAYGIADYSGNANSDLYNQIIGNYIKNIQGTVLAGSSGAGIYLSACGGDVVANNTVRNCCVSTSNSTLAPGGIGVGATGNSATQAPIVISGNLITDMTAYNGILVAASPGPVEVSGNTVRMPNSNTTGNAIAVTQSSNCNVTGNNIDNLSTNAAILFGSTVGVSNNSFVGNTINTGAQGIQNNGVGPYTRTVITDNIIVGTAASAALSLNNLAQASISNNEVTCTGQAVSLTACTQTRLTGNVINCGGTFAIATSGACTDSLIDESNYLTGAANTYINAVTNGGTGCIVSQYFNAAGSAGAHAVGDRIIQSVPVVGQPKGWRCTVLGTPGTWVSEGNL